MGLVLWVEGHRGAIILPSKNLSIHNYHIFKAVGFGSMTFKNYLWVEYLELFNSGPSALEIFCNPIGLDHHFTHPGFKFFTLSSPCQMFLLDFQTCLDNILLVQQHFLSVRRQGESHVSQIDKISSDQKYEPSTTMGYMFYYVPLEIGMFIIISCNYEPQDSLGLCTNMDWWNLHYN